MQITEIKRRPYPEMSLCLIYSERAYRGLQEQAYDAGQHVQNQLVELYEVTD
jgi:hypothetical protein